MNFDKSLNKYVDHDHPEYMTKRDVEIYVNRVLKGIKPAKKENLREEIDNKVNKKDIQAYMPKGIGLMSTDAGEFNQERGSNVIDFGEFK